MQTIIEQIGEILAAHVIADLIILGFGGLGIALSWGKVRRYWRNRRWGLRGAAVGITDFFPSRESYAADRKLAFEDYIKSARKSLQYFGHWLAFTMEQHHTLDTLCAMANAGKHVQLTLLDPDLSPSVLTAYAHYFGEDELALQLRLQTAWQRIREAKARLGHDGRKCLELRRHQEFIPYSAFWFDRDQDDSHILVDMKIYAASRKDAYGVELRPIKGTTSRYPSLFARYATSLTRLEQQSVQEA